MEKISEDLKQSIGTERRFLRLAEGYLLPAAADGQKRPIYCPSINQVWSFGKFSGKDFYTVYSHEFIHVYMTSVQPPRLLLLNEVLTNTKQNWSEIFKDIVETACELYFQVQTKAPNMHHIKSYASYASFPEVYSKLIDLWKRTLGKADSTLPKEAAMEESIRGLSVFIMHIVPRHPNSGLNMLNIIQDIKPPRNWTKSQDIWVNFYREMDKILWSDKKLHDQFILAMPIGVHRYIADTIHFITLALKEAKKDTRIITAVFPTLLELLSQESFILLPVISVKKTKANYQAEINVIHTTYRSPRVPDRLGRTQQKQYLELRRENKCCFCVPLFVSLIQKSKPFRLSNSHDRTYMCFEALLKHLPVLIEKNLTKTPSCSGCILLLEDNHFRRACNEILDASSSNLKILTEAARLYESFLYKYNMRLLQKHWRLQQMPHANKRYKFL